MLTTTSGIYIITNADKSYGTPFIYVGQAVDVRRRWSQHQRQLRLGSHHNRHLQKQYNKGVALQYTLVLECEVHMLLEMEYTVWLSYLALGARLFNIAEPGQVGYKKVTKAVIATDRDGISVVYESCTAACRALGLNPGRASCHLRGVPKDKHRTTVAPTVNGYTLKYA